MSDLLVRSGYTPMRAWIFNVKAHMNLTTPGGEDLSWWYHTAPALKVRLSKGQDTELIFDPSMYDGPVTFQEWCKPIISTAPEAVELYLTAYNKVTTKMHCTELRVVKGRQWQKELESARDELQDYINIQKDSPVFKSSLKRIFNDIARKRILSEDLIITSPNGQIKKKVKYEI
jgi:hypothetical protein